MMKLKLSIQTKNEKGTESTSQREFDQVEISIGRDAAADLQINRREISLQHAKLSFENNQFIVSALSSSAGLLVNNVPNTRAALRKGDRFQIGNEIFELLSLEPSIEILYKVSERESAASKAGIEKISLRWDINRYLKLWLPISVLLIAFAFIFFFIRPLSFQKEAGIWSSGPLHPVHRSLSNNCLVCHEGKFNKVTPERCLQCHELSPHPEFLSSAQTIGDCMNCHSEHRGTEGLQMQSDEGCLDCHNSESRLSEQNTSISKMKLRSSVFDHAEFELLYEQDPGRLKFSHAAHFQDKLPTEQAERDLVCSDCHRLKADGVHFEAIEFKRDCQNCHPLDFDAAFAGLELPHKKATEVYQFLLKQYSKSLNESKDEKPRSLPGKTPKQNTAFLTANEAETFIFEKGTCVYCHDIKKIEKRDSPIQSRFEVLGTNLPKLWSDRKLFTHQSHQGVGCVQCHLQAENSKLSSDLLIPKLQDCLSCHNPRNFEGKERSYCTSCHAFHRLLPLSPEKRQNLERILKVPN